MRKKSLAKKNNTEYSTLTFTVKDERDLKKMKDELEKLSKEGYVHIQAIPMLKLSDISRKPIQLVAESLNSKLTGKEKKTNIIDRIINELIVGAYQDRITAYSIAVGDTYNNLETIQRIRQKADNHLVRLIKYSIDIKRPPINVSVKKVDHVSIVDKQMNISKKLSDDLDKNEKIS